MRAEGEEGEGGEERAREGKKKSGGQSVTLTDEGLESARSSWMRCPPMYRQGIANDLEKSGGAHASRPIRRQKAPSSVSRDNAPWARARKGTRVRAVP